ncbi:hypothetical protein F4781DRAFT_213777 [Annulohypoxylon bovei var. microspora]|nr:hypothetical protein F4781DRAFT_213777 [Annulohypoxylon bovei var. microspora]
MSSNSNTSAKLPSWLSSCITCLPKKSPKMPTYPEFLTVRYDNAQSGPEPHMNYLPKRTLGSPITNATVEYDPSGQVSIKPQRAQFPASDQSESTLARPTTASSANTQQTVPSRQRFPVSNGNGNSNTDPRERWAKEYLTPPQLAELLDNIHATLAHVPYAICGLAALVDHGFAARKLASVSLLCPAYAKDNVRGWLRARGYETFAEYVGIPIGERGYGGEGATIYRVRIKYIEDEGFAGLERVRSSLSNAWVLGLASQIDHAAAGFVDRYRRLVKFRSETKEGSTDAMAREEQALSAIARDIFWCLDKAARSRHRLDAKLLSTLLGEEFWVPFTARNEQARTEMARAGIDVANVLARHRDQKEVRDHEAMLRQFGLGVDRTVTTQPSPFEGMQTLANRKSVYTLRPGRESVDPLPPTVPKPKPAHVRQQRNPKTTEKKGNGFFAGLVPKKSNSVRDNPPKISKPRDYGRSLTLARSRSARSPPKEPALAVPVPRFSADAERPTAEWV